MNPTEQQSQKCEECLKNQQLLQKYANLIDLLKRKNDMPDNSGILKQPIDAGTNRVTTLLTHSNFAKALLLLKLAQIQQNTKKCVFEAMRQLAIQQKCHKGFKVAQTLDRCISRRTLDAIRRLWNNKNKQLTIVQKQNQDKSSNYALLDTSQPLRNVSCLLPGQPISLNEKTRNMSRKLFTLSQQIQSLNAEKKAMLMQIEENYRRQEIQSKKKKQSLEMLAEEMAEKNELITELQQTLQFYQAKLGRTGGNILQDDSIALKKELQVLEKANDKINIQLEKKGEQVTRLQEQLKNLAEKNGKLQVENASLKQKNFEMGVELQGLQKKKKEYYNLSSFLERKLNSLKKYEKIISNNLKAIDQCSLSDKSSFNNSIKPKNSRVDIQDGGQHNHEEKAETVPFSPVSCFEAQYKIQKVLNYIYNIELEDIWIKNDQKLFDNEQLQVLNGLKLKFIQLNEQVKSLSKAKTVQKTEVVEINPNAMRLSQQYGEPDEVYFNRQVSGSIFEVLGTEKNGKEKENDHVVSNLDAGNCPKCGGREEVTSRKGEQNFTIRLLQLELQKSKQVQKISELKNKLMHIRCIVMNFIKSLDLRSASKETKDIIEIFCEFFQYSQEQKQTIYQLARKEKKFLGWF